MAAPSEIVLGVLAVMSIAIFFYYRDKRRNIGSKKPANHYTPTSTASQPSDCVKTTMNNVSSDTTLTASSAYLLCSLIERYDDEKLLQRALITIGNAAAFTSNQNILRDVGCIAQLSQLVKKNSQLPEGDSPVSVETLRCALTALNNLAMNETNQEHIEDCIPSLLTLSCQLSADSSVRLAALQVLTNLSVTSTYHGRFCDGPSLASLCDIVAATVDSSPDADIRTQALRLLVNLTSNPAVVSRLIECRDPSWLVEMLVDSSSPDVLLRVLNCLMNIHTSTTKPRESAGNSETGFPEENLKPQEDIFSSEYFDTLRQRLTPVCGHSDADIRAVALRLCSVLQ